MIGEPWSRIAELEARLVESEGRAALVIAAARKLWDERPIGAMTIPVGDVAVTLMQVVNAVAKPETADPLLVVAQTSCELTGDDLRQLLTKSEAEAAALRAVLASLRWSGLVINKPTHYSACPVCKMRGSNFGDPEHSEGCRYELVMRGNVGRELLAAARLCRDALVRAIEEIDNGRPNFITEAVAAIEQFLGKKSEI